MNTFRCAQCGHKRPQQGSGIRVVCNLRSKVCNACVVEIDRLKKIPALFKPKEKK